MPSAQPEVEGDLGRAGVRSRWWCGLDLATDLRFRLFAALFALGTMHHELQFILEQQRFGPFFQYLEFLRPV